MRYKIIKFGDRDGNGAIVQVSGFFSVTTWTANNDNYGFEKWVCRESGKFEKYWEVLICFTNLNSTQG